MRPLTANTDNRFHPPQRDGHEKTGDIFFRRPQKAQQFIQKHFAGEKVALAKVERDFLEVRYEVIFTDGAKAEFYKDGEWKEVDCRYSSVPAAVVPAQIAQYVSGHYPDASIVQIDRDKHDYEVKLSNGLELTFDLKFNLIDIDD